MATTSAIPKLIPVCYFLLKVPDIDTIGAFTSCHGLGINVDSMEYMEGGNNDFVYHLPGHVKYPNLVFTRRLTNEDNFMKWLQKTQTEPELKDVTVTFQDSKATAVRTWTFVEAFPIRW